MDHTRSFVLCDDNFLPNGTNRLFTDMVDLLYVKNDPAVFQRVEAYLDQGYYIAGCLDYELASMFGLQTTYQTGSTTGYLGVFAKCTLMTCQQVEAFLSTNMTYTLSRQNSFTFSEYRQAFNTIQAALHAGDTYQVNYTFKYGLTRTGDIGGLYAALRLAQPVSYGALVHFVGHTTILSRSPELFFQKKGATLVTQPMKGTAKRGATRAEDTDIIAHLQKDPKTRSENMMIVDLLRNDFGRIANTGSVRVQYMMKVQTYQTVHQVVSNISCQLPANDMPLIDILAAVFPCGSVTGAPKKSTMSLIHTLESEPRGVYTGAIGYVMPQHRDMCFSVPIRTLVFDEAGQEGSMHIGSGIVAASIVQDEWDECLLKAKFLDAVCT